MKLTDIARLFLHVRELPGNKGQRVEAIQKYGGGRPGDPWCAFFATLCLDLRDHGRCVLNRTGSCDVILHAARANKWVVTEPEPGDLYLNVRGPSDAYHVGIVVGGFFDDPDKGRCFKQIAGNTSEDGLSANGDRVSERAIRYDASKHVFVRVPLPQ